MACAGKSGNGAEELCVVRPAPAVGLAPFVGDDRKDARQLEKVALDGPTVHVDAAFPQARFEGSGVDTAGPLGEEREEKPLTDDGRCHIKVLRLDVCPFGSIGWT